MKTLLFFASWSFVFSAFAEEAVQYIEANIKINGEFTADSKTLLTVGKPTTVEWLDGGENAADYALLIPAPTLTEGVPNVSGLLLVRRSGQPWTVVSESNSISENNHMLDIAQPTATIDIDAKITSKEAFMKKFIADGNGVEK